MKDLEKQKKRILKIIVYFIIILVMLLAIHTVRNYVIITNLQSKVAQYINSKNYHTVLVSKSEDGMILTINHYKKENKEVVIIEKIKDNETIKISIYNNGERIDRFDETSNSKTVTLNVANSLNSDIVDCLKTENNWQSFIYSVPTIITNAKYNGKKCYKVTNFLSPYNLYGYDSKASDNYIEMETGLVLLNYTGTENKYEYEFNNVDDVIFIEPDISQYTLQEKN